MAIAGNEFFGVDMVGADPYAEQRGTRLQQIQAAHQLLFSPEAKPASTTPNAPGGGSQSTTQDTPQTQKATGDPQLSDLTNTFMTAGQGGTYRPSMSQPSEVFTDEPPQQPQQPLQGYVPPSTTNPVTPANPFRPPEQGPQASTSAFKPPKRENPDYNNLDQLLGDFADAPWVSNDPNYWREVINKNGGLNAGNYEYWWQRLSDAPGEGSNSGSNPPPGATTDPNFPNPGTVTNGTLNLNTNMNIPADVIPMRAALADYLRFNATKNPAAYGGDLTVPWNPLQQNAADAVGSGVGRGNSMIDQSWQMLQGLMGQTGTIPGQMSGYINQAWNAAQGNNAAGAANPWLAQAGSAANAGWNYGAPDINLGAELSGLGLTEARPWAQSSQGLVGQSAQGFGAMAQNGGANNIINALSAMQTQGMGNLQDQLAQIKEQYAQQGLGASSSITEALSRGASRGIADMQSQQQQLIQQVMDASANRQLQGSTGLLQAGAQQSQTGGMLGNLANMVPGNLINAGTALGNLGNQQSNSLANIGQIAGNVNNMGQQNMAALLPTILASMTDPAKIQADLMNQAGGYGTNAANIGTNAGGQYAAQATIEQQRQQQNIINQLQEFIRTSQPNQQTLGSAVGLATGFPPNQPVVQGNASSGSLAANLMAVLPMILAMSSRSLKENIVPATKNTAKRLQKLPIYEWSYKGDATRHMGPMAEDFAETFGVGDGKTLHLVDVMGVMLGAMKDVTKMGRVVKHA